jgi:hypothetical protein
MYFRLPFASNLWEKARPVSPMFGNPGSRSSNHWKQGGGREGVREQDGRNAAKAFHLAIGVAGS